jgi:hypothetical protein
MKEMEIDESKFGKHKYNRGRLRDGKWVFGSCKRGSDKGFTVNHSQNFVDPVTGNVVKRWDKTNPHS